MKISYLITRMDEFGGAQVHVRDLCLWMKAQGHDVSLLSGFSGKISDAMETRIPFYEIADLQRSIHPLKDAKAFSNPKSTKIIRPDLLTCHSSKAGLLGRLAALSLGIPSVFTARMAGRLLRASRRHTESFIRFLKKPLRFWPADYYCEQYDRHLALKYKIAPSRKITAIHNGMPFYPFAGHAIQRANLSKY